MSADTIQTPSRLLLFWRHPLTRMFARIVLFALFAFALGAAMRLLIPMKPLESPADQLAVSGIEPWLRAIRSLLPIGLAYWLLVRWIERRRVTELAPRKLPLHAVTGWAVGTAIMLVAAGAMALSGVLDVRGVNHGISLLTPLVVLGIGPGIGEEIIARGILFRVVEEAMGTWFALALSAAVFGLAHYGNPNATAWSSIAIAIEAGLLLGMAYAWTRSLWFCMALHAAWNFTQGPLLGIPVSGIELRGLLDSSTQGNALLSGGAFGAEASILTVIICVTVAALFTQQAFKRKRIVAPFWVRRRTPGGLDAIPERTG